MKLSIYTFVKNGLFYDFHVEAMLRHHAPLVDEIIVNEGYSDDGTYEAISAIDPKVKVHRFEWDQSDPNGWHRAFKNQARELCTGDWCLLLDCDEFIPEWEFERLRSFLETTPHDLVPVRFYHFYGNYKVYMARSRATVPDTGVRIHRNLSDIEVWGDGANVRVRGADGPPDVASETFAVHHFGSVRNPARLRQKWRVQAKQHNAANPKWDKTPSFMFDLFPHKWDDGDFMQYLDVYEGPFIQAVREHPEEFVRDDFWLYDHLKQRAGAAR
ncbi:MAG: glycosyltransferase family 2 protein [Acidobacteria bacterium]|nr:glycosyltransferase family 2 protein [Acidobacteriota bacterium]